MECAAAVVPDRPAVRVGTQTLTYRGLYEHAAAFSSWVRRQGLARYDVVAATCSDSTALIEALVGTVAAGGIFALCNPRWDSTALRQAIEALQPVILLADDARADLASEATAGVRSAPAIVRLAEGGEADRFQGFSPTTSLPDFCAKVSPQDPALVIHTSGSGGRPKPVLHTHRSLVAAATMEIAALGVPFRSFVTTGGLYLSSAIGFLLASIVARGTHVIAQADDLDAYLGTVAQVRPEVARLTAVMGEASFERFDLSSVRLWLQGGHRIGPELADQFVARLGPKIVHGYGTTEAMGIASILPEDYAINRINWNSVGRPFPGVLLRIVDPTDLTTPASEGRIVVGSPSCALGYYCLPELTHTHFRNGWHDTGDLGHIDDGYLILTGRQTRDAFDTEIWPQQIEFFINAFPGVKDSVVVVTRDGPLAFAELRPGSALNVHRLMEFLERHLAPTQLPQRVIMRALPRDERGRPRVDVLRGELVKVNSG